MKKNIIFVSEIHGVGKATICRSLSAKFQINHYSCSDSIRNVKIINISDKTTQTIAANQYALLVAVNNFCPREYLFLLDGHLCLMNQTKKISKIPSDTFINLNLHSIIMLKNSPKLILTGS